MIQVIVQMYAPEVIIAIIAIRTPYADHLNRYVNNFFKIHY